MAFPSPRYSKWLTLERETPKELKQLVRSCMLLQKRARAVPAGKGIAMVFRRDWLLSGCDEVAAPAGFSLPELGGMLPPVEQPHCPPPETELLVVTYQQKPSTWLCSFVKSFGYAGVSVTVLGWDPHGFSRGNNVFYYSGRVFATLRFLLACRQRLSPNAFFLFCDVDELLQVNAATLLATIRDRFRTARRDTELIFSAEAMCTPRKMGQRAWAHAEAMRPGMHKKLPRCLNTGNYVGTVANVIRYLNGTCLPCQQESIDAVYRRYTRAFSATVGVWRGLELKPNEWAYPEQYVAMSQYLAMNPNTSRWTLDFDQRLFHPNYWYNAYWEMRITDTGRLRNAWSGSTPALIHYNGNSKTLWKNDYSAAGVDRALRREYAVRSAGGPHLQALTDAQVDARLETFVREHVAFLGATFERDPAVSLGQVCRSMSAAKTSSTNIK